MGIGRTRSLQLSQDASIIRGCFCKIQAATGIDDIDELVDA